MTRKSVALAVVSFVLGMMFFAAMSALLGADSTETAEPARSWPRVAEVAPPPRGSGTADMAKRLKQLADTMPFMTNPFDNERRVEHFRSLTPPDEPARRLGFDLAFANELLNDGKTDEAVERLQELRKQFEAAPAGRDQRSALVVRSLLAIAHMRQGEQENCIAHHGIDSCLLPIRGSGVHTSQDGSRAAIEEYTALLRDEPRDLASRWLLNIAYMTVGEYPEGVPPEWLIPPQVFESEHDIKRFFDVATRVGVNVNGHAGGAIMDDFDGDGHLDLMVSSWGLYDQLRYFRNRGDGNFEDFTDQAGLTGLVGGLNLLQADYDNDGSLDVFVTRGAWLFENGLMPNSLLRNNGDGTFEDVTEHAGLLSFHPTQAAAWGDFDNDGWVDLFIGNESHRSKGQPHPCELYRNNGDGSFTEVAAEAGLAAVGYFKGAVWGDYDNDGRLDLYVTELTEGANNRLFHNNGPDAAGRWTFTDLAASAGVLEPAASFPTWFFDYDNDGWLDLFVSGYAGGPAQVAADYLGLDSKSGKPRLYRNRGDGTFAEVSRAARVDKVLLTMGSNFGDLDNDGWLDFYLGTGSPDFRTLVPNRMFRNAEGRYFQDVTTSGGFGHLQKGHGVAFGDFDNDGDQDVFLQVGGAFNGDRFQSALFENPGHGHRWVTLKLVGTHSNRAAIGARIRVTIEEPSGARDVYATVTSGSSFGASSLQQEIGLGKALRIRSIEIRWPATGRVQLLTDVDMDQLLEVHEES